MCKFRIDETTVGTSFLKSTAKRVKSRKDYAQDVWADLKNSGIPSEINSMTLFNKLPEISAGLAASIFHFGEVKIPELKRVLSSNGVDVRM